MATLDDDTIENLRTLITNAYRERDADARADALGAAVDAGATEHFGALAAQAVGDQVLALCMLARSFPRHVALGQVLPWFESDEERVRMAVVRATTLREVDTEVMSLIRRAVVDPAAPVRVAAIRAVRDNRNTNLRALLAPLAADQEPSVRRWYADL